MAHLTEGAPLPALAPYAAGLVAFIVVLFFAEYQAYHYQYGVIYQESGRQRIALAERLREAPPVVFRPTRPRGPYRDAHDRRQDDRACL